MAAGREEIDAALALEERVRKFGYSLHDWDRCEPFPQITNIPVGAWRSPARSEKQPSEVKLVRFQAENAHIFRNLYPLYLHDLSEFDPMPPNAHGVLEPGAVRTLQEQMDLHTGWLTNPALHPFLIQVDGTPAGFLLVATPPHVPEGVEYLVEEFFLLHAFRGKAVGRQAAHLAFEMFRGQWELYAMPNNPRAQQFWRTTLSTYAGVEAAESAGTTPWGPRVRFRFNNARPEPN
jgi:predicted acetyltransferase